MNLRITPVREAKGARRMNLVFVDWYRDGRVPVALIRPQLRNQQSGALLVLRDGTMPFYSSFLLRVGKKVPSHTHLFPTRAAAKKFVREHFSREFDGSFSNWKEACPVWEGYKEDTSSQEKENKDG